MHRVLPILLLAAACGSSGPDDDVRIIRGVPGARYLDVTIMGCGLESLEGAPVEIEIGRPDRPPEKLGIATTKIAGGIFSVHFPDLLEDSRYIQKVVWIDANRDGACGAGDRVYVDNAVFGEDTTWDVSATPFLDLGDCDVLVKSWPSE